MFVPARAGVREQSSVKARASLFLTLVKKLIYDMWLEKVGRTEVGMEEKRQTETGRDTETETDTARRRQRKDE